MNKIIVFASGGGSNVKALYAYGKQHNCFSIAAICCNKPEAGVVIFANEHNIPVYIIGTVHLSDVNFFNALEAYKPSLIVLAGFLKQIPLAFIKAFNNRIINIHPALLPKYGGKGMYGMHIHNAVVQAGEKETGLTIHYVNEHYDEGEIIKQVVVPIAEKETAEDVAKKVLAQEHYWLARVVEELLH